MNTVLQEKMDEARREAEEKHYRVLHAAVSGSDKKTDYYKGSIIRGSDLLGDPLDYLSAGAVEEVDEMEAMPEAEKSRLETVVAERPKTVIRPAAPPLKKTPPKKPLTAAQKAQLAKAREARQHHARAASPAPSPIEDENVAA